MLPTQILCLVFVTLIHTSTSLPQGAPVSSCQNLLPVHPGGDGPVPPESTESLFRVEPQSAAVEQGQILRIEIPSSIPRLAIKGFMIHARSTRDGRIVGRFAPSADGLTKLIDCAGPQDTATHSNTSPKTLFGLDWQAPSDFIGDIVFNSTIAQDYDKFWVGETSPVVSIVESGSLGTASGISTTRNPIAAKTTPNFYRPTPATQDDQNSLYAGCGDTKTCFGSPDNCVESKSCETFSAVLVRGDRYIFELKSSSRAGYVAVGLSDDDKMGGDSVIECVKESGSIKAYTSWTIAGAGKYDSPRTGINQNIIKLLEGRIENGEIYCQVERTTSTEVNGARFDLANRNYFLLLASGAGIRPSSVDYHDIVRLSSVKALRLSEVANVAGKSKLLLRLHGAFMIVAWIGTASIGILLARYFKQTWVGSSMCGKDIWFAWHRLFMFITWALTIAAFVIIWVEIRGWSQVNNPHAILGTITTLICFFQPIGAFFRPHPGSKRRPLFNWTHWLGGNTAHIMAFVTIFFSVKLGKAELPEWMEWILVAFVIFHVISHLLLTTLGCVSDRKGTQRISAFPMTDINHSRSQILASAKQDEVFSGFRRLFLGIYIFVLLLIVLILLATIVFAPIEQTIESLRKP